MLTSNSLLYSRSFKSVRTPDFNPGHSTQVSSKNHRTGFKHCSCTRDFFRNQHASRCHLPIQPNCQRSNFSLAFHLSDLAIVAVSCSAGSEFYATDLASSIAIFCFRRFVVWSSSTHLRTAAFACCHAIVSLVRPNLLLAVTHLLITQPSSLKLSHFPSNRFRVRSGEENDPDFRVGRKAHFRNSFGLLPVDHFPVEVKGLEPMTLCLQSRCSPY